MTGSRAKPEIKRARMRAEARYLLRVPVSTCRPAQGPSHAPLSAPNRFVRIRYGGRPIRAGMQLAVPCSPLRAAEGRLQQLAFGALSAPLRSRRGPSDQVDLVEFAGDRGSALGKKLRSFCGSAELCLNEELQLNHIVKSPPALPTLRGF